MVVGWLWDPASEKPATFQLLINGEGVGTFSADQRRGDLQRKGIGSGAHGFRIRLKPEWLTSQNNSIRIYPNPKGPALSQELTVHAQVLRSEPSSKRPPITVSARASGDEGTGPAKLAAASENPSAVRPRSHRVRPGGPARKQPELAALERKTQRELIHALIEMGKLTESQVGPLIEAAFKNGEYASASVLGEAASGLVASSYRMLNNLGRSYLEIGMFDEAIETLGRIRKRDPVRHGAIYYLGKAYARISDYESAYECFLSCIQVRPEESRYHLEAGRTALLLRFGGYGVHDEQPEYTKKALAHLEEAVRLAPSDPRPKRDLTQLLVHTGDFEYALEVAKQAVAVAPKQEASWLELSRVYMRLDRFDDALKSSQKASSLNPKSDSPKFAVRVLSRLAEGSRPPREISVGGVGYSGPEISSGSLSLKPLDLKGDLETALANADVKWVIFDDRQLSREHLAALSKRLHPWAGGAELNIGNEAVFLWRREFLLAILSCGYLPRRPNLRECFDAATRFALLSRASAGKPKLAAPRDASGLVLLVSQYGVHKFGGAEQFLGQMARIYRDLGYRVLLVGTRNEFDERSGSVDGIDYVFINGSPESLLLLCLQQQASIVHVVSGLGYEISAALRFVNIKLVFGIHFWREIVYNPTPSSGYFPDIDRSYKTRPEFGFILDGYSAVYANSAFTRGLVEREFGFRTPVIYSLPDDLQGGGQPSQADRDVVVLANARADKGFDFMIEIAALLPHVKFVAIASQSDASAALRTVARAGVKNVEVISRVSNMEEIYRRARVMLVPSFRFVETFSRVVIEAQRFGIPVVGSDRGNVPHLLVDSGIALPQEPELWAKSIDRLWSDAEYWRSCSREALRNSERYAFKAQTARLRGLLSAMSAPVLVGVGSGLGNVIHATPLIRNLARRLNRRVDVVVAGDYADLLFVVANEEWVSHAMLLNEVALNRRYETVFLTHSFGSMVPTFAANNVIVSRDWDNFAADHQLHEAEFNLAAARALLDVTYDANDISGYYLGNLRYRTPDAPLVGLHGGSKDGIWASKRWPGYADLARELQQRGIQVASFGTKDEYVEGTIDRTGGTIEEMASAMLPCSAFVANDSGVMNVANALGIPLLALFGPTNVDTRGPLSPSSRSLAIRKPCAPCEIHPAERKARFATGECRCISELSLAEVLTQTLKLIESASGRVETLDMSS